MICGLFLVFTVVAVYGMEERDLDLAKKLQSSENELDSHKELKKLSFCDTNKEDDQQVNMHQEIEDLINKMIDEKCEKLEPTEEAFEQRKKLLLKGKNPGYKFEFISEKSKKVYEKTPKS